MLEACITKAVVIQNEKTGKPTLFGVAEFYGDCLNFKCEYDWDTLDKDGFIADLKESIAKGLDLHTKQVSIPEKLLFQRMEYFANQLKETAH